MYKVVKEFIYEARREDLEFSGSGVSQKKGKESWVRIFLKVNSSLDVESARELTVEWSNRLLEKINNSEELKGRLAEEPFTVKNIEIGLLAPLNEKDPKNSVCATGMHEGQIFYWTQKPDNDLRLIDLYEESFEEAQAIVNHEQQ